MYSPRTISCVDDLFFILSAEDPQKISYISTHLYEKNKIRNDDTLYKVSNRSFFFLPHTRIPVQTLVQPRVFIIVTKSKLFHNILRECHKYFDKLLSAQQVIFPKCSLYVESMLLSFKSSQVGSARIYLRVPAQGQSYNVNNNNNNVVIICCMRIYAQTGET